MNGSRAGSGRASGREERIAEAAFQEGEKRFRTLADADPDGILVIDDHSTILFANAAIERILDYRAEELVGQPLTLLIPERLRAAHHRGIQRYLTTGDRRLSWNGTELPGRTRSGREVPLEISFGEYVQDGRHVFAGFIRDLTEQKRGERRMTAEHAVARILAVSPAPDDATPAVLRSVCEALNWDAGALWVLAPGSTTLRCVQFWRRPSVPAAFEETSREAELGHGEGLPGRVWAEGKVVWITDVSAETNFPRGQSALEADLHGAFGFPIRIGGQVTGVMEFFTRDPMPPDEALMRSMEAIGTQLGHFLRRKQAEEERDRALSEAVEARREAELARMEAEAANHAKSEFLATMSHEIRTPINAIMGYTDLLETGISGPVTEKQRSQLERVRSSSEHLLGLVDDILDLARIDAGRINVEQERALAVDAVREAIDLVRPQAAARGIVIEAPRASDDEAASYVGDADRVRQILVNLLANAVKFTEPDGRIVITCGRSDTSDARALATQEGPWIYIRVTDTGIGIAAEEIEKVFRPFVQAEAGLTRRRGGSGLGLTISLKLARLMGGDLTLESEPGQGSTFTIWLPERAPFTESLLADAVGGAERRQGMVTAGQAVLDGIDDILDAYREQLSTDPRIPMASRLTPADLADHSATLLTEVGLSLYAIGMSAADREHLIRDGTEIQRVICELHGAQRARLGWTEDAIRREFEILRDETETVVQRAAGSSPDLSATLALLRRLLDHAEQISTSRWRQAKG